MIRLLRSDVTKLALYFTCAFLLAALMTPWLYNAGMALGEITAERSVNPFLDWLGTKAKRADFPTYFKRSLLISGVLLLIPLIYSLRLRRNPAPLRNSPWTIYLPSRAIPRAEGQPLRNPSSGWLQLFLGFIVASGLFACMGWLLLSKGWFTLDDPIQWNRAWKKSVGPMISASLLEEIVFRGMLLGICLRSFRPSTAIIVISILFAALHFLQPPDDIAVFSAEETVPAGGMYIDPNSSTSGFQMLLAIGLRFQQFDLVLFEFISLLMVGLILGYARWATASLWLPIGLHSGWIFAYKFFGRIADRAPDLDSSLQYIIGTDLKEGFLPLATLAITAILVTLLVRMFPKPDDDVEDEGSLPSDAEPA